MLRLDHPAGASALLSLMLVTGMLVTAGAGGAPGPREEAPTVRAASGRPSAPGGQALVVLRSEHVVRAAPDGQARRIGWVAARRPLTHVRTVLPVLGRATGARGGAWVHVRLPGRPNGHAGWVSADRTQATATSWRIVIRLSSRLVTVYHEGRVEGRFRAVVGQSGTPTPRGRFFVEEGLNLTGLGRPYALATSARSGVYREFEGGPGQVALHATTGLPGVLGTAASHGCLRLSARAMRWLSRRIGPGVPLTIRA